MIFYFLYLRCCRLGASLRSSQWWRTRYSTWRRRSTTCACACAGSRSGRTIASSSSSSSSRAGRRTASSGTPCPGGSSSSREPSSYPSCHAQKEATKLSNARARRLSDPPPPKVGSDDEVFCKSTCKFRARWIRRTDLSHHV